MRDAFGMEHGEDAPAPPTCFVVGPIGDRFAEAGSAERKTYEDALQVLEEIIQPACEAVGLSAVRADRIAQPGEIPEQIFEHLRDTDIVIADLTGGNPNVMYELGMRHTRPACTVSIAERERIPFDVSVIRTIVFRRTPRGLIDAREDLIAALRECLAGNYRAVTATRLWAARSAVSLANEVALAGSRDLANSSHPRDDDDDEPRFLERLAEMEDALPRLTTHMEEISGVAADISSTFGTSTSKIESLAARGKDSAAARLHVAREVATELERLANRLDAAAAHYESDMSRCDSGMLAMIEAVERDPHRLGELGDLPGTVHTTAGLIDQAMVRGEELAENISGLSTIARPLAPPSRRIAAALRRVTRASLTPAVGRRARKTAGGGEPSRQCRRAG